MIQNTHMQSTINTKNSGFPPLSILNKKNGYYSKFLLNSRHRVQNFMDIISFKPQTIERDKKLPRAVGNFLKPQINIHFSNK